MLDRLTPENLPRGFLAMRSGALAALGRTDEAKAAAKDTLGKFPEFTIEEMVSQAGWNDAERQRVIETLRLAGFPSCAKPEVIEMADKPTHLPECAPQ